MKQAKSVIWRRLNMAGHEYARVFLEDSRWLLEGTSVFVFEKQFCKLDYSIECGADWQTRTVKVLGWVGEKVIEVKISVDAEKRWTLNGKENAETKGCTDIDLNFSPITNTLPIQRIPLCADEKVEVCAAWLRFPEFTLEPLAQIYTRISENKYRYESADGTFQTEIETDDFGLIAKYPHFWQIENL